MERRRLVWSTLYYGGLGLLMALILTQLLDELLPGIARPVRQQSEGYTFAIIMAAWLQFVRPRIHGTNREWPVTFAATAAAVLVTLVLMEGGVPGQFATLDETFAALVLLIPWVQLRRPLRPGIILAAAIGVLVVTVAFNRTVFVTEFAETFGFLLLAVVGFDVVDRWILDRSARSAPRLQMAWWAFLVAAPVTISMLARDLGDGLGDEVIQWLVRIHESWVGVLLVSVYLAVLWQRLPWQRLVRRRGVGPSAQDGAEAHATSRAS